MGRLIVALVSVVLWFGGAGLGATETPETPHDRSSQSDLRLQLARAAAFYSTAERSTEPHEAMRQFNAALEIYQSVAVDHFSPGLYFNLANCYFQLGEYPWAIFYYERALRLAPRDRRVVKQLQTALLRAGLGDRREESSVSRYLGLQWLSVRERVACALGLGCLLAFVGSISIWTARRLLYRLSVALAVGTALLLATALVPQLFLHCRAIVIKGAMMRCDGGEHYALVASTPLLAGSKIVVKTTATDRQWIEIVTAEGEVGYIPAENVRIL